MVPSSRENEIKLAFPSPETAVNRLLAAGARELEPRAFEDNFLFDLPDLALKSSGRLLRLRAYRGRSVLTFKAPVAGEHRHKLRVEHELTIGDPEIMRSILFGLGFAIVYRYQKYRATYALAGIEAAVDETPIGTFVELEGDPDDVDAAAAKLGASSSDFICATYRELQERDAAARGVTAGDMLLSPPTRPESVA